MTAEKPLTTPAAPLDWAVRLLYLQAAGLAAVTVYLVVAAFSSGAVRIAVAASLTVLAALAAAAVFLIARALGRRALRARGPAVVVQLFLIATGGFLVQTEPVWLGATLIALAALTAVLMLLPASSRALGVD